MKIVVFPGVNSATIAGRHKYFLNQVTSSLGCEGEIFLWENPHVLPVFDLPLQSARETFCGVVLDFQKVLLHALEIPVPPADIYIGHSAGSIMALVQDKPCVMMASPASLIETMINEEKETNRTREKLMAVVSTLRSNDAYPILNLINRYDIVAYPLDIPSVENYEYTGAWYNPNSYNPLAAHSDYWTNKDVINKVVATIKSWKIA